MFRNPSNKALIVREAIADDDHALGGDFIFADILAMIADLTALLYQVEC